MTPPRLLQNKKWSQGFLCLGLALALWVRLHYWKAIFRNGRILFIDVDDYYHLRRILVAVKNFPFLPSRDFYMGYPGGFYCFWPPLHDLFIAGLALIFGAGRPSQTLVQTVAALTPPIAGTVTAYFLYQTALAAFGQETALVALFLSALSPPFVGYTLIGRPDHHCFENFWSMLAFLCLLRGMGQEKEKAQKNHALMLGMALVLGQLFWIGSMIFSWIIFLFAVGEMTTCRLKNTTIPRFYYWLHLAFFAQIPVFLAVCGGNHWFLSGQAAFDAPSPFHPLMLACLGFCTLSLYHRLREGWTPKTLLFFLGALACLVCIAGATIPNFAYFISAPPKIFSVFSEYLPLMDRHGRLDWTYIRASFGNFAPAIPLAAALLMVNQRRAPARLLGLWLLVTGLLALWRRRYALHFALPASLAMGYGLVWLNQALRRWIPKHSALAPIPVAVLAAWMFYPFLSPLLISARELAPSINEDLVGVLEWIRDNTPKTKSLWKEEGLPEYGVFSLHNHGMLVAGIAERPTLAGDFHTQRKEVLESIAFLFMRDAEYAYKFLSDKQFKYVLLTDMFKGGWLPLYAKLYDPQSYETFFSSGPEGVGLSSSTLDLVYSRVYLFDGSTGRFGPHNILPAEHFRLIHESPVEGPLAHYKVFELVRGAVLEGRAEPKSSVVASTLVTTNQKRSFTYLNFAVADRLGRFSINAAYPGWYTIRTAKTRLRIQVDDEDIRQGRVLNARAR